MDYEKIKVGRAEDLTGQRFGNWTVLHRTTNSASNKVRWVCQCYCEQQTIRPVEAKSLKFKSAKKVGPKDLSLTRYAKLESVKGQKRKLSANQYEIRFVRTQ